MMESYEEFSVGAEKWVRASDTKRFMEMDRIVALVLWIEENLPAYEELIRRKPDILGIKFETVSKEISRRLQAVETLKLIILGMILVFGQKAVISIVILFYISYFLSIPVIGSYLG